MALARSQLRKFWNDSRNKQNEEKHMRSLSASLPSLTTTMRDTWRSGSTHNRSRGRVKQAAQGLPALEDDTLRSTFQTQEDYEARIQKELLEQERKHRWEKGNYLNQERSRMLHDVQGDLENREVAVFWQRSKEATESDGKPKYTKYKDVVNVADMLTKCMRAEDIERINETSLDEHRTLRSVMRIDDTVDVARMIGNTGTDQDQIESAMKSEVFLNVLTNLKALRDQVHDLREARNEKTQDFLSALATGAMSSQLRRKQNHVDRHIETPKVEEHRAIPLKESLGKMDSWMSQNVAAWQKAGMFSSSKSTASTGALPRVAPSFSRPLPAETVVIPKAVADARELAVQKRFTT